MFNTASGDRNFDEASTFSTRGLTPTTAQGVTPDKYGSGPEAAKVYGEGCLEMANYVVATLAKLRVMQMAKPETIPTQKALLRRKRALVSEMCKTLMQMRHAIAEKTASRDAPLYGQWRDKDEAPEVGEVKPMLVFTTLTGQYGAIVAGLKERLYERLNMMYDSHSVEKMFPDGITRYKVLRHVQTSICFEMRSGKKLSYPLDEAMSHYQDPNFVREISNVTGEYGTCSPEIYALFERIFQSRPKGSVGYKEIIEGRLEIKVGEEWLPLTTHVSWIKDTVAEFNTQSVIAARHTPASSLPKLIPLLTAWLSELATLPDDVDPKLLTEKVAKIHFLCVHMTASLKGWASTSKTISKGCLRFFNYQLTHSKFGIDDANEAFAHLSLSEFVQAYPGFYERAPTANKNVIAL